MKKPTFNFSSNPAIKGLTKTEKQAVANYVSSELDDATKWVKLIKPMPFDINLEEYVKTKAFILTDGSTFNIDCITYERGKYCIVSPDIFEVLSNIKSEIATNIVTFIARNIKYNSNIIVISDDDVDIITKNRQVFDRNIRQLCSYEVLARTTRKDTFIVNPKYILYGRYDEFMRHYKKLYENKDIETNKYGRIVIK